MTTTPEPHWDDLDGECFALEREFALGLAVVHPIGYPFTGEADDPPVHETFWSEFVLWGTK